MRPLKFTTAADWAAVKAAQGWDAAGRPPAYVPMPETPPPPSRGWQQSPVPPMGLRKSGRGRGGYARSS